MQVEPMKPALEAPGTKRLKHEYDEPPTNFAFKINLRRYRGEKRLKHCARCPADNTRAHYCGEECQRADWVARHRGECAEARRARQAAGTEL